MVVQYNKLENAKKSYSIFFSTKIQEGLYMGINYKAHC